MEITPSEVREEVKGWLGYLNEVIGVMCFTFGLASLGTPNPPLFAFISFIFVMLFHAPNASRKARILSNLSGKRNRTEFENVVLKDYRSQISFASIAVMMFGYIFLALVFLLPVVKNDWPVIYTLVYGSA